MLFKRCRSRRADPDFPWLEADHFFRFPAVELSSPEGIVCTGGNLSPGMLLSAYRQGIFPWFGEHDPLLWWSPDPRFVVRPGEVHLSGTMRKLLRKQRFSLTLDRAFPAVIRHCAAAERPGQSGTWIGQDMIDAYIELHRLGYAHSAEAWLEGELAGGLYGISLGGIFFGESMFSLADDASKAVFIPLAWHLEEQGFCLIDSQVYTDHVASLGGQEISRGEYLKELAQALCQPDRTGSWDTLWPDYPNSGHYKRLVHKNE